MTHVFASTYYAKACTHEFQAGVPRNSVSSIRYFRGIGAFLSLFDVHPQTAVSAVASRGVVFVSSAGNDHTDNDVSAHWPSNIETDTTISVAALDRTGAIWCAAISTSKHTHDSMHLSTPNRCFSKQTDMCSCGSMHGWDNFARPA